MVIVVGMWCERGSEKSKGESGIESGREGDERVEPNHHTIYIICISKLSISIDKRYCFRIEKIFFTVSVVHSRLLFKSFPYIFLMFFIIKILSILLCF